jgi:phthiocerol/phenolphthiocerol synthesis type-I polyketide synthase B
MTAAFGRISGMTDQQRAVLSGEFDKASRIVAAEPVAVVGIGCRFPGDVEGPERYWRLLVDGEDAISEVPADRWNADAFYDPDPLAPGRMTTKWGGFISDIARFDADFFGITPREAEAMDPQQRMLLEVAWEALENAGTPPDSLAGTRTGVMMGVYYNEYQSLSAQSPETVSAYTGTGNAHSVTVGRVAYLLGLRGPAVAVDTACSSSLVAVHLACQSLRLRETDLALAGGVNVILRPETQIAISAWGLLSADGRCKSFDASANGFVRGEGCGVVVLKRLVDAVRDGDRVLAVVRGSAINQDGRSNGVTAPNAIAQREVITAALRAGEVTPDSVDYIETHGTGTVIGDPIEFEALAETYGRGPQPCALGSSKTNLGHLEAAAGIAGFIKATLAVQHGQIPPNLHFSQWNPGINPSSTRLFVPTDNVPWPGDGRPRRAAVSSFGFGGTNAHVVLEQGPTTVQESALAPSPPVNTLVVSAKTPERLASWAGVLADWMADAGAGVPLADIAHSVNHHRALYPVFATVCASDPAQAISGLRAVAVGQHTTGVVLPHSGTCGTGTVFVYSGQGSQWAGMGRQLLADEPAFAAAVDELEPAFTAETGFSLRDVLAGGEPVAGSLRVQSVLVGMQLALTALWRSCGVEPDTVIGHSMGEVSAAVVAGALSAAEGLRVIATRARLMSRFEGHGAVASIHLDPEATEHLIADHPDVTVTVYASPRQTVVAGPVAAIDDILARAAQQNTFARRVNMEVPSHHAMMDPLLPELRSALDGLAPRAPRIRVIPTALESASSAPLFDADYWVANVREPVRFRQAVATAGVEHTTFVEVSPHTVLAKAISETLGERHHHSLGTLQRDSHDTLAFHTNLNATHTVRPPRTEHTAGPHSPLPNTPWRSTHYWIDTTNVVTPIPVATQPRTRDSEDTGGVPTDWLYEPRWHARPLPTAHATGEHRWVVLAGADLGAEFSRVLGSRATVLPLRGLADNVIGSADYVLYAPPVASVRIDDVEAYRLFNESRSLAAQLVDACTPDTSARLLVVTRNAQPVTEGDRANPVHGVLWGLGRTLALEHPEIWGGLIDLDETVPAVLAARCVLAEAQSGDGEDQVVYRGGVRYVPRLERGVTTPGAGATLGPEGSHLVVGATGNIGPHLIGQLADMGAKTIVAVSRDPGSRLDALSERLAATGVTLIPVAADAADESAMSALFDRFGAELPALEGIYLAAFAGGPVTLGDMTSEDVNAMFRPKLDAVRLLHELSLRTAVRQFVLFSSISGILGSRWLGHYAATSTFLDTVAFARRALGLPATVVNWGVWKSLADNQTDARQVTSGTGMEPMDDGVAIRALAQVMRPGAPVRSTIVDADWPRLAAAYRTRGSLRVVDDLLAGVADTTAAPTETEFRKALHDCAPERRRHLLLDRVSVLASAVMGLSDSEVLDPSAGFFQLGMDSLMSVTLGRNLSETLGEPLTPAVVFDYPTVEALTDHLATVLPEFVDAADEVSDGYDDFTEDELLQQLSERLG